MIVYINALLLEIECNDSLCLFFIKSLVFKFLSSKFDNLYFYFNLRHKITNLALSKEYQQVINSIMLSS